MFGARRNSRDKAECGRRDDDGRGDATGVDRNGDRRNSKRLRGLGRDAVGSADAKPPNAIDRFREVRRLFVGRTHDGVVDIPSRPFRCVGEIGRRHDVDDQLDVGTCDDRAGWLEMRARLRFRRGVGFLAKRRSVNKA